MATPRDENREQALAFVHEVMRQLGITPDERGAARELARALGWAETDNEVKVGRWVRGAGAPNFLGTMALLRVAGRLRDPAEEPSGSAAGQESTGHPLRELAVAVGTLVEANTTLHSRLAAVEKQLEEVAQPRSARSGSKRAATGPK